MLNEIEARNAQYKQVAQEYKINPLAHASTDIDRLIQRVKELQQGIENTQGYIDQIRRDYANQSDRVKELEKAEAEIEMLRKELEKSERKRKRAELMLQKTENALKSIL